MANYNSGVIYNEDIRTNGANYNSNTFYMVQISDSGTGQELLLLVASMLLSESGLGEDVVSPIKFTKDKYFVVSEEGILSPLGVMVLRDSRHKLIPSTRDNTEEIPGRHGEIDFGSELKPRPMELHVATPEGLSPLQKEQLKRTIAKYLNPVAGTKKLVFLDDIDVQYEVKYAGEIDLTKYTDWMEFTIPFKMSNPLIESTVDNFLVGSGVLTNNGTFETGLIIEISGPVTNPSLIIDDTTLAYTGTVAAGQKLVIDTDAETAKIGSNNAMDGYNGEFPLLQPGSVNVTADSNVTIRWKDKYL